MAAKKNMPRPVGAGRKKGVPNQLTTELKDMIRGALDDAGGRKYLAKQANENPIAFMSLISKIIPKDLNIGGQADNALVINIRRFADDGDNKPT